MKEKVKVKKNKLKGKADISCVYLIPLAIVLAIVPLIVRLRVVELEGIVKEYWPGDINYDFFSYYKAQWIIWCTVKGAGVFLYLLYEGRVTIKKTKIYIPMGVYSFFVILSTVFSQHKSVALWGFPDRYEGMFVLLSYMVLLFITINMVNSEKHIKFLLGSLLVSATVVSLIGLFQFMGYDLFRTGFGKQLILPREYSHLAPGLKFEFESKNMIYTTLLNPNYVGSYMALLIPLTLMGMFQEWDKKYKLAVVVLSILFLGTMLGSKSQGGLVGLGIALMFLIIVKLSMLFKLKFKSLILGISIGITLFLIIGIISMNQINLMQVFRQNGSHSYLHDVNINGNEVGLRIGDASINFIFQDEGLYFTNEVQEPLKLDNEDNIIKFQDSPYKRFTFSFTQAEDHYLVTLRNFNLRFLYNGDEFVLLNGKGQTSVIEDIEQWGFNGQERLGSARGFIWSRSLPLIKDTILIGVGSDVYPIHFPQNDYIGKLRAYRSIEMLVDKPHSFYLQTVISTGVVSMSSLAVLLGMYMYSALMALWRDNLEEYQKGIILAISVSIVAYLATASFNDSVVSVAPIFWMLLGIGQSLVVNLES